MSNWQSPPNAAYAYPSQPGPTGNFNQAYPPPPGPGFVPPPSVPPSYSTSYPEDPTQDEAKGFDFSEKSIRLGFIRKVYLLLMSQLLLTFGIVAFIFFHPATNSFVKNNRWLFWVAFVVAFVTLICMVCCSSVARKTPMNYIFLFMFTGAESFLVSVITTKYRGEEILLAFGITIVLCFSLTLFAFQTKWDFTGLHTVLFVCLIGLMIFSILTIFWTDKIKVIIYGSLGAILFSFYLIYDTQMMMGGEHKYSISPEDYVFATLSLYLDIINIFLYILQIIGASD